MVRRNGMNMGDQEPEQKRFERPSEGEHFFQIVDVYTCEDEMGAKLGLDDDTVVAKCEVCGGSEEGRSLLIWASLDVNLKGFFATRLLLKAIGEEYKGKVDIDTDNWIGKQFYASVIHNGQYANVDFYVDEKNPVRPEEVAWDEEEPPAKSGKKGKKSSKKEEDSPL